MKRFGLILAAVVVFAMAGEARGVNKGFVDYEIKTIKTLGYENTINGKHVDGDVDVLGM